MRARRTELRRRCKHCSRSLTEHARADALFCSTNCRGVSHRRHARVAEHTRKRSKCQSCRGLIPCRARSDALYSRRRVGSVAIACGNRPWALIRAGAGGKFRAVSPAAEAAFRDTDLANLAKSAGLFDARR